MQQRPCVWGWLRVRGTLMRLVGILFFVCLFFGVFFLVCFFWGGRLFPFLGFYWYDLWGKGAGCFWGRDFSPFMDTPPPPIDYQFPQLLFHFLLMNDWVNEWGFFSSLPVLMSVWKRYQRIYINILFRIVWFAYYLLFYFHLLELCWKRGGRGGTNLALSFRLYDAVELQTRNCPSNRSTMWSQWSKRKHGREIGEEIGSWMLSLWSKFFFLFTNIPDHQQTSERQVHRNSVRYAFSSALCFDDVTQEIVATSRKTDETRVPVRRPALTLDQAKRYSVRQR